MQLRLIIVFHPLVKSTWSHVAQSTSRIWFVILHHFERSTFPCRSAVVARPNITCDSLKQLLSCMSKRQHDISETTLHTSLPKKHTEFIFVVIQGISSRRVSCFILWQAG